jgi:hypothetical protein
MDIWPKETAGMARINTANKSKRVKRILCMFESLSRGKYRDNGGQMLSMAIRPATAFNKDELQVSVLISSVEPFTSLETLHKGRSCRVRDPASLAELAGPLS